MKTSEALKATKAHLWDGKSVNEPRNKSEFVCLAALRAGREVPDLVVPIIQRLLGDRFTLGAWLMVLGYTQEQVLNVRQMQLTRHAWLDHLINHYESQGD